MKSGRHILALFMSFLGFYSCYILSFYGLNPIMASAITGLVGSFFPKVYGESPEALIYASSFAAIGIDDVGISYSLMWLPPVFVFILYEVSKTKMIGYGGKLGTMAFISVGIITGALWSI